MTSLPPIPCPFRPPSLPEAPCLDLHLLGAPSAALAQSWLACPGPRFRPGRVWTAHSSSALFVTAELEDDDIANSARSERQPTWATGDVFEIFLRPQGQDAYFEFHITPENFTLRVRFPSTAYFQAMAERFPSDPAWVFDLSLPPTAFTSATRVQPAARRWTAAAVIPFSTVLENGETSPSRPWLASFCRYDTTRGLPDAELSSTSPYPQPHFHDQSHWRELHFLPTPASP